MSSLPHPELTKKEALEPIGSGGRSHVPSNELTAEGYAPIYHDTKSRMESIFGKRPEAFWPIRDLTCSKCYSLVPELNALIQK